MDSESQQFQLAVQQAETYYRRGLALRSQGRPDEALADFRQALSLKPDYAEAHYNLGATLASQGKLAEAVVSFQQALHWKPQFAEAHHNLGNALKLQGKFEQAIASFQRALHLKPNYPEAHNCLASALADLGKFEEAIAHCRHALRLNPQFAEAFLNQGLALKAQGKIDDAIASYQQALRLKPDLAEAYNNLGNALSEQRKFEEAIASYQQALRLKPRIAEVYNNLAIALKELGRLDEAIRNYRQALSLRPEYAGAHDNLLFIQQFHPDYDSDALYQEARQWNEQHAEPLAKFRQPHTNNPDPARRLRVGYVSADFYHHAVSHSLLPLLSNHDRQQVEVFCYAQVARPDDMTDRLRACADVWRPTVGLSDEQLAGMVRNDAIDILVDLGSHTANNRLLVFARKPAPVQVSWMGYPGTTGLSAIDYRLTDPYLDPPGKPDSCYAEQSLRLPDSFWCYDPLTDQPPVNDLPALTNGYVTFGCLNNFCKVNDGVLKLWAQVLLAVPRSRLLLLAPKGQAREHVLAMLMQRGIGAERVEFADRQKRQHYLQMYNRIDLGLDPLPYNGHTTSLDAFWMGVSTLTLIGKTVVGRAGWSQLCNLNLQELAARTPEEYIAIASKLAEDLPRLQELRATMRARMLASPVMDGRRFARHVEQAFRQIWTSFTFRET